MDIEATLQAVVDRQQIIDTLFRYASTIDTKDFDGLRSLFVDGASARYGADRPAVTGADEIVSWIRQMTLDRDWQHRESSLDRLGL